MKLVGNDLINTVVRVESSVQDSHDQYYGIREDVAVGNSEEVAACVEFRCRSVTWFENKPAS